jgi:hypothetical protein
MAITILNKDDRIFESWGTVGVRDIQGDLIPISEIEPIMLTMMKRGGNIIDGHSNRTVGKILNFVKEEKQLKDGGTAPGIKLISQIFKDYKTDDEVWDDIVKQRATGMSFGGKSWKSEHQMIDGKDTRVLKDIEGFEFTVVRPGNIPVNSESNILAANTIAKSEPIMFAKMMNSEEVEKGCNSKNLKKEIEPINSMAEKEDTKNKEPDKEDENKNSLNERMAKVEKAVSDIAKLHEDVMKSISDIAKSIEAKKAVGTPDGTMPAGSGEGDKVKLPTDIAEKTHEKEPSTSAGEKAKIDKSVELQDLKKDISEIKDVLKSIKVEKVSTGRPSAIDINKSMDETDIALKIARNELQVSNGDIINKSMEAERQKVADLFK